MLASCEYDFIRVDENHVQYPSNNISILHILSGKASQIQFFPSSPWCFYITNRMVLIAKKIFLLHYIVINDAPQLKHSLKGPQRGQEKDSYPPLYPTQKNLDL